MTENFIQKVILITGASSGFGSVCAEFLSWKGHIVYGTSRQPGPSMTSFKMIQLDVNDDSSVKRGICHIMKKEGRLDVVINNAGIGIAGAIEDMTIAEMRYQFETNFFGVFRVCHEVLPIMRAQKSGHIITIGSIAGLLGLPFQGGYSASKFALEGLMESLRMEVKPFGIHGVLIEPGDFNTGFTRNRIKVQKSGINSAYDADFNKALQKMEENEKNGSSPDKISELINHIIDHPSPRPRYMIGSFAEKLAVHLKKILPQRLFEHLIMKTVS